MKPLNCKEGELAVWVKPSNYDCEQHYLGRIVRVRKANIFDLQTGEVCWSYESPFWRCACGNLSLGLPDDKLRPIRPDEGDDETLEWAGKPVDSQTPVPA